MNDDWDLVVASFQAQYGIRLSRDLRDMKWREFSQLLSGLDSKSPLGRIIAIRAEEDPEVLKSFTKDQKRIRSEWLRKRAKQMPQNEVDRFIESMKQAFLNMA